MRGITPDRIFTDKASGKDKYADWIDVNGGVG
jgi:hypothetical protein